MPPRPNTNYSNLSQSTTPLKSNNPFLHVPPTSQNDPGDDDDEELRKALAMSKEEVDGEARQERERSVRASGAPPPSPEEVGQGGLFGPLFGPSERVDEEGKMAMVPASQVCHSHTPSHSIWAGLR